MKKRYLVGGLFHIILLAGIVTSPSEEKYLHFSEELYGEPPPSTSIEVEQVNFLSFLHSRQLFIMNTVLLI